MDRVRRHALLAEVPDRRHVDEDEAGRVLTVRAVNVTSCTTPRI
jgi:hypothetical protein